MNLDCFEMSSCLSKSITELGENERTRETLYPPNSAKAENAPVKTTFLRCCMISLQHRRSKQKHRHFRELKHLTKVLGKNLAIRVPANCDTYLAVSPHEVIDKISLAYVGCKTISSDHFFCGAC
jgi:hypothetical protein